MALTLLKDPPSFADWSKAFQRITAKTFCQLFDSHPDFQRLLVVDCRTQGEYDAGHIKGAIRRHPFESGFDSLYAEEYSPLTLFVFHCEFSALRGPEAIRRFSELHQAAGRDPTSLHAFVLDGGFSAFYAPHTEYCVGRYATEWSCWQSQL
jgi:rhodanese-related sulfurtransferase